MPSPHLLVSQLHDNKRSERVDEFLYLGATVQDGRFRLAYNPAFAQETYDKVFVNHLGECQVHSAPVSMLLDGDTHYKRMILENSEGLNPLFIAFRRANDRNPNAFWEKTKSILARVPGIRTIHGDLVFYRYCAPLRAGSEVLLREVVNWFVSRFVTKRSYTFKLD